MGLRETDLFIEASAGAERPERGRYGMIARPDKKKRHDPIAPFTLVLCVSDPVFCSIRAELFYKLVVNAEQKERCDPLADEMRFLFVPGQLEYERCGDRAASRP